MIPKIMHFIWLGNLPQPKTINLWRDLHPDWEFHLWTDQNLPVIYNNNLFKASSLKKNMQADILRVSVLYEYGGIYLDADMVPFKNISPLLQPSDTLLVSWENEIKVPGYISNAFIGASAKNPVFKLVIRLFEDIKPPKEKAFVSALTGPKKLTPILKPSASRILPSTFFCPEWCDTKNRNPKASDYPNSYGFHLWAHSNKLEEYGW